MAELLTKIPTSVTEYPKSFKRQGCFPLEAYSVFYATADKTALEAAQDYAATNGIAYVGQTLAVVTTNAQNASIVEDVTFYIIADTTGTLQEVGKATNGDGNSIILEDGTLSLAGFEAAGSATLPQKSPVFVKDEDGKDTDIVDHYELKWVAIDSIVEGDTNTKTVVTRTNDETRIVITPKYDKGSDTHTYELSLDLSAIEEEIAAIDEKIGAPATDTEGASGVYAAIASALSEAKQYADTNDADTVYDDTEVKSQIKAVSDRVTTIEGTLGDDKKGLVHDVAANTSAIAAEIERAEAAEAKALTDAKAYTDTELTGIKVEIAKKTIGEGDSAVEAEHIILKNKVGTEIASVDATKFVKDGMITDVAYDSTDKTLTIIWNTDSEKDPTQTVLNIGDLVDVYTAGTGIKVANNQISIDDTVVATVSDLEDLSDIVDTKQTAEQVAKAIEDKLTETLAQYTTTTDLNTALESKVDTETYAAHLESYTQDKATFATKDEVNAKVSTETYNADKATFALTETVNGQINDVEQSISDLSDTLSTDYYNKTDIDGKVDALEEAVAAVDDKADSNTNLITNLTGRIDGIVAQGGEPNTINTIKINGVAQTIDDQKAVDISVPVIADTKVSDLKDGTAFVATVNKNVEDIAAQDLAIVALQKQVGNEQTGLSILNTRLASLETEVGVVTASRIDALEGSINGDGAENKGLVGAIAANTIAIAALEDKDTELDTAIKAKADASKVYTKTETDSAIQTAIDTIPAVDLKPYAKISDVEDEVSRLEEDIAGKADANNVYEKKDVYTKTEADAAFLTESEVDSRINALINAADPKGEDGTNSIVITNIQNLVKYVDENASDIAALVTSVNTNTGNITTNTSNIATNTSNIAKNTEDIAALSGTVGNIETAIAAIIQPKASNEITVATDGTLGINKINVNKLTQTEGEDLILNGGGPTATTNTNI